MIKPPRTNRRPRCPKTGLALALSCLFTCPLFAGTPESLSADFESFFLERVIAEAISGAAFVIASPNGIVAAGTAGYTDTSRAHPIDENTAFRVASVSKTFAAGLTALLVQDGAFGWNDRVVDYVPGFRIKGDSSRVRVQDLLGQSTGLIPHAYDNLIEDGLALEEIEARYRDLTYVCAPGECYSYQNSIFSLIEPVIETATAQSYEQLMAERIFRPLDMRTASIGYEAFVANPNHAQPHVKTGSGWKTVPVQPNYYRVAPAAGVNASVLDMGKWLSAQMGAQPAVLAPAVVETLTQPRVKTARDRYRKHWRDLLSAAHYGLGWRIYRLGEYDIAYHSGWVSGYRADIAWSRSHGIGVAILMNVEGNSISELTTTFWRMAFEQLPAGGEPAPPQPVVAALARSGH
jgi:beta-lactamase class C